MNSSSYLKILLASVLIGFIFALSIFKSNLIQALITGPEGLMEVIDAGETKAASHPIVPVPSADLQPRVTESSGLVSAPSEKESSGDALMLDEFFMGSSSGKVEEVALTDVQDAEAQFSAMLLSGSNDTAHPGDNGYHSSQGDFPNSSGTNSGGGLNPPTEETTPPTEDGPILAATVELPHDVHFPPVPEPSSYGVWGAALLVGLWVRRRVRSRKEALSSIN